MFCNLCGMEFNGEFGEDRFCKTCLEIYHQYNFSFVGKSAFCIYCGKTIKPRYVNTKYGIKYTPHGKTLCPTCNPYQPTHPHFISRIRAIMNENKHLINIISECPCVGKLKIKHHEDYGKPLDVMLLCLNCHHSWHQNHITWFNEKSVNFHGVVVLRPPYWREILAAEKARAVST